MHSTERSFKHDINFCRTHWQAKIQPPKFLQCKVANVLSRVYSVICSLKYKIYQISLKPCQNTLCYSVCKLSSDYLQFSARKLIFGSCPAKSIIQMLSFLTLCHSHHLRLYLPKASIWWNPGFSPRPGPGRCHCHISAIQCSAVQCSAVQCSAEQCSAVQYSDVQCKAAVHYSAVQCQKGQCIDIFTPETLCPSHTADGRNCL